MTVAELIAELQKMPQDAHLVVSYYTMMRAANVRLSAVKTSTPRPNDRGICHKDTEGIDSVLIAIK